MQDPISLLAKFGAVYSHPGRRVLLSPKGSVLGRPTPLELKLSTAGSKSTTANQELPLLLHAQHRPASYLQNSYLWHSSLAWFCIANIHLHAVSFIPAIVFGCGQGHWTTC